MSGRLTLNRVPFRTELTVAEMNGWIIEVRSTYRDGKEGTQQFDRDSSLSFGAMSAMADMIRKTTISPARP